MNSFYDIVGHEQVKKSLQKVVSTNTPSHAYLLYGGEGVGKRSVARAFAKALECSGSNGDCCNQCISCKAFDSENHPDVIYVRLNGKKSLGVEEIREQIVQKAVSKQYQYEYKIFIIENADAMTAAAQNALLKTLEEPPHYAVFLLLADNKEGFLPTILSRTVLLPLRPLSDTDVKEYLKSHLSIGDEQAAVFSAISQGSIGQAMEMAGSEEFAAMRRDIINKLLLLTKTSTPACLALARELEIYKDSKRLLDMIYLWYRDLLAVKCIGNAGTILQQDFAEQLHGQAAGTNEKNIISQLDAVWQAQGQLRQNASFISVMEVLFIKLKESS